MIYTAICLGLALPQAAATAAATTPAPVAAEMAPSPACEAFDASLGLPRDAYGHLVQPQAAQPEPQVQRLLDQMAAYEAAQGGARCMLLDYFRLVDVLINSLQLAPNAASAARLGVLAVAFARRDLSDSVPFPVVAVHLMKLDQLSQLGWLPLPAGQQTRLGQLARGDMPELRRHIGQGWRQGSMSPPAERALVDALRQQVNLDVLAP